MSTMDVQAAGLRGTTSSREAEEGTRPPAAREVTTMPKYSPTRSLPKQLAPAGLLGTAHTGGCQQASP